MKAMFQAAGTAAALGILLSTPPARASEPCGTTGTVDQRITACATSALDGAWSLVARTANGSEVWRDNSTRLIWGDVLRAAGASLNHSVGIVHAIEGCGDPSSYLDSKGGLPDLAWALPLRADFQTAEKNRVRQVLPHLDTPQWHFMFWSATIYNHGWEDEKAAVYSGRTGKIGFIPTYFGTPALCVAPSP
jgi:hypothetical protein